AIEHLLTAWQEDHDHRVKEWNAQQQAEVQEAGRQENKDQARREEAQMQAKEQIENERREAERKKLKMNNFTSGLAPPNVLEERPSQYTLTKLAAFKFIPLWYFTLEGCSDNAYGLTSTNNVLTLKPVALVKASKNARPDELLTFGKFLQARVSFLLHIKKAAWPDTHIDALAMFFWNMESHPQCANHNGDLIILTYAAAICRKWHSILKANTG
ncbi:hypothetical protein BS17DRAFT_648574, partial [Gyrodon lividus]